jgi:hypothetical protein
LLDETTPRVGLALGHQVVIGHRIADVAITAQKLVIEVDGPYHQFIPQQDHRQTRELAARGYRVIRFTNEEVIDETQRVMAEILRACGSAYEMASDTYIPDDFIQPTALTSGQVAAIVRQHIPRAKGGRVNELAKGVIGGAHRAISPRKIQRG